MNIAEFCKKLEDAEAHSEFVIAVFCDIRAFSSFSRDVESADTSTFLKHFYLKLLRDYFADAVFAKPTGDGLLMIYRHTERDLDDVSRVVFSKCFKAIRDFPKMFRSIPILNYAAPDAIGFGVARGAASCLIAGNEVIDYSGKLLNLAARLNELARPTGLVVDGNYQLGVIPNNLRKRFKEQKVFIRGIAEECAINILCSSEVVVPSAALHRIREPRRKLVNQALTVAEVKLLLSKYFVKLPFPALPGSEIVTELVWSNEQVKGHTNSQACEHIYEIKATGCRVLFDVAEAQQVVEEYRLKDSAKLIFRVDYVPKRPS